MNIVRKAPVSLNADAFLTACTLVWTLSSAERERVLYK